MTRKVKKGLVIFVFFALILTFSSPGQAVTKAALFSLEFLPVNKFKPLSIMSQKPLKEETAIISNGRILKANILRPKDNRKHPAAIIVIGVDTTKDDPSVEKVAEALSRLGFVAIAADIPDLLKTTYDETTPQDFVSIFKFAEAKPYVDPKRIGFVGFCLGSSLAVLAAEDSTISNNVYFVSSSEILFDLYTVSRDVSTKSINNVDSPYPWQPHPKTKAALFSTFLNYLPDQKERATIFSALENNTPLSDYDMLKISSSGKKIYRYLSNEDPSKSKALWDQLPQSGREKLTKMSPKTNIGNLRAKIFITTGREVYLPHTESRDLANSIPKKQREVTVLRNFEHDKLVRLPFKIDALLESIKLISHVTKVFLYTRPYVSTSQ